MYLREVHLHKNMCEMEYYKTTNSAVIKVRQDPSALLYHLCHHNQHSLLKVG